MRKLLPFITTVFTVAFFALALFPVRVLAVEHSLTVTATVLPTPMMVGADMKPVDASFLAVMHGYEEVPGPGSPNGFGFTLIRIRESNACVKLIMTDIGQATAAHIHTGVRGVAGPVVVTLPTPDATGVAESCVPIDGGIAGNIIANPSRYYVNVHTADFPDGAVRGQLH